MDTATKDLPVLGLGQYFEDLAVGRRFQTIGRTITEPDIVAFINCTGMTEVLFTNFEFLEHESDIKGRLAPGSMVFCFAEGLLVHATMQHTGFAFLGMTFKIEAPVFAGDTIHVEVEVVEARRSKSRPGRGIVTTHNRILNQRGECVLTYSPTRMIRARSTGEE